ncbi:hypothetical protein OG895_01630 [Streptomyces sp. NBC_00201]|uniref:hypothetical protein n=1 Tax=unclassified Streptomyces TaxID=2593676 RepID=UPI0022577A21|nr:MULTISPECIES: hypothetical protein [unclassified Streptomyces]MCX5059399.1 hypothetical protein [Streptomyces sp. NBC_00452]MCX5243956.1 hypothetical protein [Streptomyces sp. NBC_00201]MCX5290310.1 hypothetical protein [Streptomyces sp. NBC_00183]
MSAVTAHTDTLHTACRPAARATIATDFRAHVFPANSPDVGKFVTAFQVPCDLPVNGVQVHRMFGTRGPRTTQQS